MLFCQQSRHQVMTLAARESPSLNCTSCAARLVAAVAFGGALSGKQEAMPVKKSSPYTCRRAPVASTHGSRSQSAKIGGTCSEPCQMMCCSVQVGMHSVLVRAISCTGVSSSAQQWVHKEMRVWEVEAPSSPPHTCRGNERQARGEEGHAPAQNR